MKQSEVSDSKAFVAFNLRAPFSLYSISKLGEYKNQGHVFVHVMRVNKDIAILNKNTSGRAIREIPALSPDLRGRETIHKELDSDTKISVVFCVFCGRLVKECAR